MDRKVVTPEEHSLTEAEAKPWGKSDGKEVYLFRLANSTGTEMFVTNFGAVVQSLLVPDKRR